MFLFSDANFFFSGPSDLLADVAVDGAVRSRRRESSSTGRSYEGRRRGA